MGTSEKAGRIRIMRLAVRLKLAVPRLAAGGWLLAAGCWLLAGYVAITHSGNRQARRRRHMMTRETSMTFVLALAIGVVAGSRAMMAPAAVSWAARLGWLPLDTTPLAFLGYTYTPWIFTVLALVELVTDQLPTTPSRTVPMQFGARILTGGLSGAAIGAANGALALGAIAGIAGAVMGTLGGRALRGRLAQAFGNDHPAALIEDAIAIVAAYLIVAGL
jgi:uncharacterized membrane protein